MATEHYCDYCGELIEDSRAGIESAHWLTRNPVSQGGVALRSYLYHSDGPESCLDKATRALEDMAAWAHRKEGSEMQWQLVQRTPAEDPSLRRGTEEFREALYRSDLHEIGIGASRVVALIEARYTSIEQLALCTDSELAGMSGVGAKTIAQIKKALEQRGMALGQGEAA